MPTAHQTSLLRHPGTNYPSLHENTGEAQQLESPSPKEASELSDAEREAAIVRAGKLIEKHMATWASDGCMAARGDADRARAIRARLIAGRPSDGLLA